MQFLNAHYKLSRVSPSCVQVINDDSCWQQKSVLHNGKKNLTWFANDGALLRALSGKRRLILVHQEWGWQNSKRGDLFAKPFFFQASQCFWPRIITKINCIFVYPWPLPIHSHSDATAMCHVSWSRFCTIQGTTLRSPMLCDAEIMDHAAICYQHTIKKVLCKLMHYRGLIIGFQSDFYLHENGGTQWWGLEKT